MLFTTALASGKLELQSCHMTVTKAIVGLDLYPPHRPICDEKTSESTFLNDFKFGQDVMLSVVWVPLFLSLKVD